MQILVSRINVVSSSQLLHNSQCHGLSLSAPGGAGDVQAVTAPRVVNRSTSMIKFAVSSKCPQATFSIDSQSSRKMAFWLSPSLSPSLGFWLSPSLGFGCLRVWYTALASM